MSKNLEIESLSNESITLTSFQGRYNLIGEEKTFKDIRNKNFCTEIKKFITDSFSLNFQYTARKDPKNIRLQFIKNLKQDKLLDILDMGWRGSWKKNIRKRILCKNSMRKINNNQIINSSNTFVPKITSQINLRKDINMKSKKELKQVNGDEDKTKTQIFFSSKISEKIKGYAYINHRGLVKKTNEDKICIENFEDNNISIIKNDENKIFLFAIFDGHCGESCSKYLSENFLQKVD